jgi:pSer/pThr/pTyr-binding forkhead associated (FHA) protein
VVPTTLHWRAKHFKLEGDLIRIGRSEENDIVLSVKGISRHHCQLRRQGGKLMLEDLGSTNGTLVNGRRLTGQYAVSVGDEIQIAEEHLRFEGD